MAQEKLHRPFWINKYHVKLLSFTVKQGVVHYKVHISEDKSDLSKTQVSKTRPGPIGPSKTGDEEKEGEKTVEHSEKEVPGEKAVEYWQKEVEGEEDLEYWQKEVEGEEAVEDWQKEVEEEEVEEVKDDLREAKKRMRKMALPFLSHAGFLSANLKESGGGDLPVQVGIQYIIANPYLLTLAL